MDPVKFLQDRIKELADEYKAFAQIRNEQQRATVHKAAADYKVYSAEYAKVKALTEKAKAKTPLTAEEVALVNKVRETGKSLYNRLNAHTHIDIIKQMVDAVLRNKQTLVSLQKYAAAQPKASTQPAEKQEKEAAPAPKFNMFLPADIQATMNEIHRIQTRIQQLQKELNL